MGGGGGGGVTGVVRSLGHAVLLRRVEPVVVLC